MIEACDGMKRDERGAVQTARKPGKARFRNGLGDLGGENTRRRQERGDTDLLGGSTSQNAEIRHSK